VPPVAASLPSQKPENLVFKTEDPESNVLLCDFGVSMPCGGEHGLLQGQRGTQSYMAPEMLNGDLYGQPVDMWSLGVILYSLLSGSHPFDPYGDLSEEEVVERVQRFDWDKAFDNGVWGGVSADAKHVVQGLMKYDPAERWTCVPALPADAKSPLRHAATPSPPR